MLVLFSSEPKILLKLRASLPAGQPSAVAKSWTEFENKAPDAECSTVVIEWLHRDPAFPLLCGYKARHPKHPLALVTRWDSENARHLKDVFVEEVVWFREVERELPSTVERLCTHRYNFVHCLAVPFETAEHLPTPLRRALAHACRSERPVGSIKQLAGAVGSNRSTLWLQWNQAVDSPLRLQDFLHWILLLRIVGRKTPGQSWAAVAEQVGVSAHSLARFARQLTGMKLQEVAENQEEVVHLFHERVLNFVLKREPLDILGAG